MADTRLNLRLEGRIALGLDEFMLRLGHLKVLISVLKKTYGNRARIARHLADSLTQPVLVPEDELQDFGEYLVKKNLSVVVSANGKETAPHSKARYSHLRVTLNASDEAITVTQGQGPLKAWFQDVAIASRNTRSKVGAVTADTREITNKTGVSHLVDWASIAGIANRRLGLTAVGRALEVVSDRASSQPMHSLAANPYVIGPEKLALAWMLFTVDGDVLTRLISKLVARDSLGKSEAMELVIEIYNDLRDQANRGGASVTVNAARAVRDFQKDLGLASGASRRGKPTSTVWHRISSRLESLTDLGLLEKNDSTGASRQFDYYYRPTDSLRRAAASLQDASTPTEWVDAHLADALTSAGSAAGAGASEDVGRDLLVALKLSQGPTGVHIDSFTIVAASLASMNGRSLSFAEARARLTRAAMKHPEVIRLSRGYTGSGAEFASVALGQLEQLGESAFSS